MRKWFEELRGDRIIAALGGLLFSILGRAQVTFPVNGITDPRTHCYAFTRATIVKDDQTTLNDATIVIREGKIIAVGNNAAVPKDAVVIDCSGKYIYPSLIDIYTDYGIPQAQRQQAERPQQFASN